MFKAPRFFFYLSFVLFSCTNNQSITEYKTFFSGWEVKDKAKFMISSFSEEATNLIIHIRNDNRYRFSNIFLIATIEIKGQVISRDTLEYEMADPSGKWLGSGFAEVKESKLWWKEGFIIPKGDNINAIIEHAVRANGSEEGIGNLEGIIGVGLSVEKVKN
jgi:gliding motility-associated lipoprotein GldH